MKKASRASGPSAAISLAGVLVGCALALLLLPAEVSNPEDLRWPATVFAAGLMFGPMLAALRRPEAIVHPLSVLLGGLVYWVLLDLIQAKYVPDVIAQGTIALGLVAVALFAFGVCVAHFFPAPRLPRTVMAAAEKVITPRLMFRIGVIAFVASFLRFAIPSDFNLVAMYEALFASRWAAPWARGQLGGWDAFLDHMAYFGYVLPALSVLLYRLEGKVSGRAVVLACLSVVICLLVAQGGGRRIVGAVIAAAGVTWVLTTRRKGLSIILLGLVGVPALLSYLQFVLESRGLGIVQMDNLAVNELSSQSIDVDDNFNRLTQLIEIIPDAAPHVGLDWVVWILVRPIPRVLWPYKPVDAGFDLSEFLGLTDVSLTSSIVGESYTAFGFLGCVVVGLVFGFLGRALARLLAYGSSPSAVVMYAVGLLALFLGLRSAIEVVLFGYVFLAWIVLSAIMARKARRDVISAGVVRRGPD